MAADITSDVPSTTEAKSLPCVQVDGAAVNEYKVDQLSAPKFTQALLDTTQTISVISKKLMQVQGVTTLTEALLNSPGVGTFYVGANGTTSADDGLYMRGVDTSSSIFVDGVRDLGSISRDVLNIEQVEVTKSPASTDNGRTALTGSINMVSKQPELGSGLAGSVSYGSGDHRRATTDWNQSIGETSALRLNVMGQDSGIPGPDKVENNRWAVARTFAFGLGTATRIYLDYLHVNVPDGGIPTVGLPGYSSPDPKHPFLSDAPMVDTSNFYGTTDDHDHVTADMFTALIEHDFSADLSLHNTTRWGRTSEDYPLTSFLTSAANLLTPNINDPSTSTIARSNHTFKHQNNRIITNQTNLRANVETGAITHSFSTGVELAKTNTVAAYLFDTPKFNEHWQLNAGVRLDHYTTDYTSRMQCGLRPYAAACPTAASSRAWTPPRATTCSTRNLVCSTSRYRPAASTPTSPSRPNPLAERRSR